MEGVVRNHFFKTEKDAECSETEKFVCWWTIWRKICIWACLLPKDLCKLKSSTEEFVLDYFVYLICISKNYEKTLIFCRCPHKKQKVWTCPQILCVFLSPSLRTHYVHRYMTKNLQIVLWEFVRLSILFNKICSFFFFVYILWIFLR